MKSEIHEFAELLIVEVRDKAIRECDSLLLPQAKSPIAEEWRKAKVAPDAARVLIPDIVDTVLFALLHAIDNERVRLKFVSQSGEEIDLSKSSRAELAGRYGPGENGWLTRFAKERFFDFLADSATRSH